MASLSTLPPELHLSILPYLPFSSLKDLSLCSHHFRTLTLPYVFTTLHLPFNHHLLPEFLLSFKTPHYRCDGIGSIFHAIRGNVKYITISTPDPSSVEVVKLLLKYYDEVGRCLYLFKGLKGLVVGYSSVKEVVDLYPGFDGVCLAGLFNPYLQDMEGEEEEEGLLSHYKTLESIHLEVTMTEQDEWLTKGGRYKRLKNTMREHLLLRHPAGPSSSTEPRFIPPKYFPSLKEFTLKLDIEHQELEDEESEGHPLFTDPETTILSLLTGSRESLTTLSIWVTNDKYNEQPEILFPKNLTFPNVKTLRFHSWWLWNANPIPRRQHLCELARVAPNTQNIDLYFDKNTLVPRITMHQVIKAMEVFGKRWYTSGSSGSDDNDDPAGDVISKIKKIRMYWPIMSHRRTPNDQSVQWAGTLALGVCMMDWVCDYGLEDLETVVFVRIPEGREDENVIDEGFEAVAGRFVTEGTTSTIEWSEVYRERLLDLEEQAWLRDW
ncbi:hypothetical protein TWF281_008997 [Arthrobotrys megalospora]